MDPSGRAGCHFRDRLRRTAATWLRYLAAPPAVADGPGAAPSPDLSTAESSRRSPSPAPICSVGTRLQPRYVTKFHQCHLWRSEACVSWCVLSVSWRDESPSEEGL